MKICSTQKIHVSIGQHKFFSLKKSSTKKKNLHVSWLTRQFLKLLYSWWPEYSYQLIMHVLPWPSKCFSQSLSLRCSSEWSLNESVMMDCDVSADKVSLWACSVSFFMDRIRRLVHRKASSNASIQHLPEILCNMLTQTCPLKVYLVLRI